MPIPLHRRSIVKGVVVGGAPNAKAEPDMTMEQLHLENANLRRKLAILEAGLVPMRQRPEHPANAQAEGTSTQEAGWYKFLRISRTIHKLPAISFDPTVDDQVGLDGCNSQETTR